MSEKEKVVASKELRVRINNFLLRGGILWKDLRFLSQSERKNLNLKI